MRVGREQQIMMAAAVAAASGLVLESRDLEQVEDVEIEATGFSVSDIVEDEEGQRWVGLPSRAVRVYPAESVPCAYL